MSNKKFPLLTGIVLAVTGLSLSHTTQAQQVEWVDEGCYSARVNGVEGEIDYDDQGNLAIWDAQGNFLAYAPDHCYNVVNLQQQQEEQPPPPPPSSSELPPPPPPQNANSGVKNSNTVPYCDELPQGSTAQCQQRITLDLGQPQQDNNSGVKNSNTVPYCDELPQGSTAQCQQKMTLD